MIIGKCYRLLKRPLPAIFYFLSSIATLPADCPSSLRNLLSQDFYKTLIYYRSQFIRLQTDLQSSQPRSALEERHSMLNSRLCMCGLAYLVESVVWRVGINDTKYILRELENHLRYTLSESEKEREVMTTSNLVYLVLVVVVMTEYLVNPSVQEEEGNCLCVSSSSEDGKDGVFMGLSRE